MTAEEIRQNLGQFTIQQLRRFAEIHQIPIPEDKGKEEIISRILEGDHTQTARAVGNVRGLDLAILENNLAKQINEAASKFTDVVKSQNSQAIEGLNTWTKILIWVVTVSITLFSSLFVYFFQKAEHLDSATDRLATTESAYRGYVTQRLMHDCRETLGEISVNLIAPELEAKIRANESTVEVLIEDTKTQVSDDHNQMLAHLSRINKAILSTAAVNHPSAVSIDLRIDDAANLWRSISNEDISFKENFYEEFSKESRLLATNILGVLELRRYRVTKDRPEPILEKAQGYFQQLIQSNAPFARPYTNMAVVYSFRFESERAAGKPSGELYLLLDEIERNCMLARGKRDTPKAKSLTYNTLANHYLQKASLQRSENAAEAILKGLLDEAAVNIDVAIAQADRSPVVYITKAEIECEKLAIGSTVEQWSSDRKKEKFQEIMALVQSAKEQSYTGYDTYTRTDFLEKSPYYKQLNLLDPDFLNRLLDIALGPSA